MAARGHGLTLYVMSDMRAKKVRNIASNPMLLRCALQRRFATFASLGHIQFGGRPPSQIPTMLMP